MNIHNTINQYGQFCEWTNTLHHLSDKDWHRPLHEGKASIAEIISHLRNWDLHLIHSVIPSIQKGEGMEFPDFDSFNRQAYEYANSGISKEQLLLEFSRDRMKLIVLLNNMNTQDLLLEVTANGVANCPNTGTPYSLFYIIQEFTEHDEHHKNQIVSVLE